MWDFTAERLIDLRRVVRRETIRLVVLTAIACVAFFVTRAIAQRAEERELQDAEAWYERGLEYLEANPDRAAIAFRRAVTRNRAERRYSLALAQALVRSGHEEPAARVLESLREFNPEDPQVNLALARLLRAQGDEAQARRYYHHAIYAPDSSPADVRAIRLELVRMFLDAGDPTRANAELIAAAVDDPDTEEATLELARLFEEAGNHTRAAEQYQRVLARNAREPAALEGAVRTAFAQGLYREVLRYSLPPTASAAARDASAVARELLSRDPLATRLTAAERRRRLMANITYLQERWRQCGADDADTELPEALRTLQQDARRPAIGRDSEALEAAVATLDGVRVLAEQRCGTRTPTDRAIELIARSHGIGQP